MRLSALSAASILAGAMVVCACSTDEPRPNVVLLVLDTVRRDHLGSYGYARDTSPALDAFAAEATLYSSCTSAAPWTLPSHASMFTGLAPSKHQAHHEHLGLDEANVTLAESLGELGYETAGFCNNPWITETTGLTQGFMHFVEVWRTQVSRGTFNLNVFVDSSKHGISDAGAEETLHEISDWLDSRDASRPFFLFANLIEAHSFYDPPGEYRNRFTTAREPAGEVKRLNRRFMSLAHSNRLDAEFLARIEALYDGEIAYLDAWCERFFALLKQHDVFDTSLVVVTSDHGEAFGEHSLCGVPLIDHQLNLHEEVLAVPLLIRYPRFSGNRASSRAGVRVDVPVSLLDLAPTILDVVGAAIPESFDGFSLAQTAPAAERVIVAEYFRPLVHLDLLRSLLSDDDRIACLADRRVVAVRSGNRKLISSTRGEPLLFDLAADPGEEHPLPIDEFAGRLLDIARARLATMATAHGLSSTELGDAQREALQALGYVR